MLSLPAGFRDLGTIANLHPGTMVNTIAIIESYDKPSQVKTGKTIQNLYVQDPSQKVSSNRDMRVNFYVDSAANLPKCNTGDILLMRKAKVEQWQSRTSLTTDRLRTTFLVFPRDKIPAKAFTEAYMGGKQQLYSHGTLAAQKQLSLAESCYVIRLNAQNRGTEKADESVALLQSSPSAAIPSVQRRPPGVLGGREWKQTIKADHDFERDKLDRSKARGKLYLVENLAFNNGRDTIFADLCVQVVKKFNSGNRFECLVTDYTENKMLYDRLPREHTQNHEWHTKLDSAIPYGQYTLKVVVETPHREWMQEHVSIGDVVLLQNVKLKLDDRKRLQGDMWPDSKYPGKVMVQRIFGRDIKEVRDIYRRKTAYDKDHQQHDRQEERPLPSETKPLETGLTKQQAKRKKQKRKDKAAADARAADEKLTHSNKNIQCSGVAVELSSVREMLDLDDQRHTNSWPDGTTYRLPFVNASFKAKLQVIDFYPDRLESFAMQVPSEEFVSDDEELESNAWEWAFQLLVQDASVNNPCEQDRMVLNVGHAQAQFLLGADMPDPADLEQDGLLLTKLRERLFVLWGDLQERKQQGAKDFGFSDKHSNRPFQACVWEYGVLRAGGRKCNIDDWRRQYMLHGVTIL